MRHGKTNFSTQFFSVSHLFIYSGRRHEQLRLKDTKFKNLQFLRKRYLILYSRKTEIEIKQ